MLTVVLKATRGNPQVKVPAPSLETGSYPKDSRRHGQPAPIVAGPAYPAPPDQPSRPQTAPRSGSDPRQATTRSPAPNSQGCATAAAIELRRSVCAAGQPARPQVSRRIGLSVSDRKYPPLTGRSGTQRARGLQSRTTDDSVTPWSSSPSPGLFRATRPRTILSHAPPSNPIAAEPYGRRVLSGGGEADHAVDHAVTPQAPLTGSGCREYSYGGFGGGLPHFHPHAPDLLIRSSGQAVQDRPGVSALWTDVPDLPTRDRCHLAAWQQCWQQSSASRPLHDCLTLTASQLPLTLLSSTERILAWSLCHIMSYHDI